MNRAHFTQLILLLLIILPTLCPAQEIPTYNQAGRVWLGLGFGGGNGSHESENKIFADPAFHLSTNAVRTSSIFTVRYTRVGVDYSTGDLALLYGKVFGNCRYHYSIAAGIGLLYSNYSFGYPESDDLFNEVGLAWEAQFYIRNQIPISYGLTCFGSIIGEINFVGLAIGLQFGGI